MGGVSCDRTPSNPSKPTTHRHPSISKPKFDLKLRDAGVSETSPVSSRHAYLKHTLRELIRLCPALELVS